MTQELIILENLTKRFNGITAVNNISLQVRKKQVLGFLGPNGAGKSTTMKMIAGFLEPSSGTVIVDGYNIVDNPVEVKSRIGYLPEGAPSYGDMTTFSFLDFVAEIRGYEGKIKRRCVEQVVDQVELGAVLFQRIDTLSKGFRRRVGLAQAMMHDPQVLILDEPTDGLDPNQKHQVRSLINEMAKSKAIIVSTHILEEVEAVCTDAVIIADGLLLEKGTPEELISHDPNHNSVVVRVHKKNAESVCKELKLLGHVSEVDEIEKRRNQVLFRIQLKKKAQSLVQVNTLIREKKLSIEEVYSEKGALDKVFRQITNSKD